MTSAAVAARNRLRAFPHVEYQVARALSRFENGRLSDLGLKFYDALLDRPLQAVAARLRVERAVLLARRAGSQRAIVTPDAGLKDWHPAGYSFAFQATALDPRPGWVAHQGHIAQLAGSDTSALLFDVPLGGTYEFSLDVFGGGSVTQNGLIIEAIGGRGTVAPLGRSEAISHPWNFLRADRFNRFTVKATPSSVRYFINGHLLYEDKDPSPTSPWLGLITPRVRQSVWKNLTLSGHPTIPQEIPLSHADRLDGWVSTFYSETQPPRRSVGQAVRMDGAVAPAGVRVIPGGTVVEAATNSAENFDWSSHDGVITGRKVNAEDATRNVVNLAAAGPAQSRLEYVRPLRTGDVLSYEFLYEPGEIEVHPSMDRLAFLLDPSGIRLHWMTSPTSGILGADDPSGLPADNVIDEPGNRRGSTPLPLKTGEWNRMKVALEGDTLTLELNGQAVYERKLEPENTRQFSFFHEKHRTAARVRHVVLRGQWPQTLSDDRMADLLATKPDQKLSDADRRAAHDVIGETVFALEADDVLQNASGLDPSERYRRLADWVLPTPDHAVFRLSGGFTPTDPVGSKSGSGGAVRSPAIELRRRGGRGRQARRTGDKGQRGQGRRRGQRARKAGPARSDPGRTQERRHGEGRARCAQAPADPSRSLRAGMGALARADAHDPGDPPPGLA